MQQGETHVKCGDVVRNEMRLQNALKGLGDVKVELGVPVILAFGKPLSGGSSGACEWLIAVAAEEAVRSNNTQLLLQMMQEGWFQKPLAEGTSAGLMSSLPRPIVLTSLKQQLAPALLAAAAGADVEAGKVLLRYCPDLLDYVLWHSPAIIEALVIDGPDWFTATLPLLNKGGPYLEVLPLVSKLHMEGFKGLKLEDRAAEVLVDLCYHDERHQPESMQLLLELGVVSSQQYVKYQRSKDLKVKCPILAFAAAEKNAGAVAVLVAAGAVLPDPDSDIEYLPFNYNDLQAVVEELEQQAAAAGGGRTAIQYGPAADMVRGYCEQHGREKIESKSWK